MGGDVLRGCIVATLILLRSAAALELPSQTDLRAAYCLRLTQMQLSQWRSAEQSIQQEPGLQAELARNNAEITERLRRLQQYLQPRQRLLAPEGLRAAEQRAEEDRAADDGYLACISQCIERAGPRAVYLGCSAACFADSPKAQRWKACVELDWLPY